VTPPRPPAEVWAGPDATSLEELFDRAAAFVEDQQGWEPARPVQEGITATHFCKTINSTVSYLLSQCRLPLPFHQALWACNPEVSYNPLRAEFDSIVTDCRVVRLFAPGDALVSRGMNSHPLLLTMGSLLGVPGSGKTQDALFRVVRRRNFPRPGMWCCITACVDPEQMMICEGQGVEKTRVVLAQEDGDTTLFREIVRLHRIPKWAMAKMPGFSDFVDEWVQAFRASRLFALLESGTGFGEYLVISIRKCERGPPLLPANLQEDQWMHTEAGVSLPEYLQRFGELAGLPLEVYDRIDGQHLVPYQAAVSQLLWNQLGEAFLELFRRQRTAYRRINGGSSAPTLKVGVEGRFVASKEAVELGPVAYGGRVTGTFLDFREISRETSGSRSRCGSAH